MILGEDVILQLRLNGLNWTDFMCDTGCSIEPVTEFKSVKTLGSGAWKDIAKQVNGYTLTAGGLIPLSQNFNAFDALKMQLAGTKVRWRSIFTDNDPFGIQTLEGIAMVASTTFTGPAEGHATADIKLEGKGKLIQAATLCNSGLGTMTTGASSVTFSSIPGTTVRIDYERFRNGVLDSRNSLTPAGGTAAISWLPSFMSPGQYQYIFYAICSSGQSGAANQHSFTIS